MLEHYKVIFYVKSLEYTCCTLVIKERPYVLCTEALSSRQQANYSIASVKNFLVPRTFALGVKTNSLWG